MIGFCVTNCVTTGLYVPGFRRTSVVEELALICGNLQVSALSAVLDTEEVTSSILVSPTMLKSP